MHQITPTIKLFTSQDADSHGIHINSLIFEHRGNNYQFPGGSNDVIHVFAQGIALYVLTANATSATIALNAFMVPEPDSINCIYLHNEQHIHLALGQGWQQLSPATIVEKLINHLM